MTRELFTGVSAFPLTPLHNDVIDADAFANLVTRLAEAGVDSITALGSTGSYAYLTPEERAHVARIAVEHAGEVPVFVGVGALRTSHVLANVDSAEESGAAAVLLAPMTYQPLTDDDVFELFAAVTGHTDLPVIVYDNPGTTHFTFSTELYGRIAALPGIASIKIPPLPQEPEAAHERLASIRRVVPEHVTIGISGDAFAAAGLAAGCDAWYSVIAGTLPELALEIVRAQDALAESAKLAPLWNLFAEHGSLRVTAAIAEHLGLVQPNCLPLPIRGLGDAERTRVAAVLGALDET